MGNPKTDLTPEVLEAARSEAKRRAEQAEAEITRWRDVLADARRLEDVCSVRLAALAEAKPAKPAKQSYAAERGLRIGVRVRIKGGGLCVGQAGDIRDLAGERSFDVAMVDIPGWNGGHGLAVHLADLEVYTAPEPSSPYVGMAAGRWRSFIERVKYVERFGYSREEARLAVIGEDHAHALAEDEARAAVAEMRAARAERNAD